MNENTSALDDGGAQGPGAHLLAHPSYTQAASKGPSQDAWAPWSQLNWVLQVVRQMGLNAGFSTYQLLFWGKSFNPDSVSSCLTQEHTPSIRVVCNLPCQLSAVRSLQRQASTYPFMQLLVLLFLQLQAYSRLPWHFSPYSWHLSPTPLTVTPALSIFNSGFHLTLSFELFFHGPVTGTCGCLLFTSFLKEEEITPLQRNGGGWERESQARRGRRGKGMPPALSETFPWPTTVACAAPGLLGLQSTRAPSCAHMP